MLGRTMISQCGSGSGSSFNGGPSNCSAERPVPHPRQHVGADPSMEGRAIARPNLELIASRRYSAVPSMEGRGIARPNIPDRRMGGDGDRPSMGPSNCSAEPGSGGRRRRSRDRAFNGGPSNCSAGRRRRRVSCRTGARPSMEGRAIARPDGELAPIGSLVDTALQWRAEQLLGRTGGPGAGIRGPMLPSMEGRAIARPDPARVGLVGAGGAPSMEGRAIAPAGPVCAATGSRPNASPSMEGRAIARPDFVKDATAANLVILNGGPSNCSAGPGTSATGETVAAVPSMEGRAIARPDPERTTVGIKDPFPSMEGRAIARPGPGHQQGISRCGPPPSMEGRAIARPDDAVGDSDTLEIIILQWRAEQLLGRTLGHRSVPRPRLITFNGGPSNCSAGPESVLEGLQGRVHPSMEGRAIARPDPTRWYGRSTPDSRLQWRAEQLLGRTCTSPKPKKP